MLYWFNERACEILGQWASLVKVWWAVGTAEPLRSEISAPVVYNMSLAFLITTHQTDSSEQPKQWITNELLGCCVYPQWLIRPNADSLLYGRGTSVPVSYILTICMFSLSRILWLLLSAEYGRHSSDECLLLSLLSYYFIDYLIEDWISFISLVPSALALGLER